MKIPQVLGLAAVGGLTTSIVFQSFHLQSSRNLNDVEEFFVLPSVLFSKEQENTTLSRSSSSSSTSSSSLSAMHEENITAMLVHSDESRPPLHELVDPDTKKLTGADVSWLLDFAIVGFGKCGTTTLMNWLADHPEVQCFKKEQYHLTQAKPEKLVKKLYTKLPSGPYKRGYKAPTDVTMPHVLQSLEKHFPKAGLIVGIRHPIFWFQSLYNFRTQNFMDPEIQLPHPEKLIGKCGKGSHNTCTFKGDFAFHLLKLGKTNTTHPTDLEHEIHNRWQKRVDIASNKSVVVAGVHRPNKVFLFEISQLSVNSEESKMNRFRSSIRNFVGLRDAMPTMPHKTPGKTFDNATQVIKNTRKIQICEAEYVNLRRHLMELSRQTYHWLMESFLDSPEVFVSDRRDFQEAMKSWLQDPCDAMDA